MNIGVKMLILARDDLATLAPALGRGNGNFSEQVVFIYFE